MDRSPLLPISSPLGRLIPAVVFASVLLLAVFLRFKDLGMRSLWGDEFCTWKVSQMPLAESLRWQPELTKPPLYQLVLRGMTGPEAHRQETRVLDDTPSGVPSEWHLRFPAAVCGTLAVAAMWWLGSLAGGWTVGAAAALLFAVNEQQLHYSQEARPYSMLMLGSLVSTGLWYRLNDEVRSSKFEFQRKDRWIRSISYVVVTALTFHANYLMVLTVAAQACWALLQLFSVDNRKSKIENLRVASAALLITALVCVPIVWHFMRHRTSVFQGLDWIPPATIASTLKVLTEISFGWLWVWILLVPAVVWVVRIRPSIGVVTVAARDGDTGHLTQDTSPMTARRLSNPSAFCWLLLIWLAAAWGGLLIISWIAQPAMVERYALPAAAPVVLLPLVLLHQIDWRLPLMVAVAVSAGTAPVWLTRTDRVKPGFREMVAFLDEYADPEDDAVVVAIERTTSPGWEEMDLLGFEYYESSKFKVQSSKRQGNEDRHEGTEARRHRVAELYMRDGKPDRDQWILQEPRALWVVTFLADPLPAIESAGRRVEQIKIGDRIFDQLSFEPYRLIRVAAKG